MTQPCPTCEHVHRGPTRWCGVELPSKAGERALCGCTHGDGEGATFDDETFAAMLSAAERVADEVGCNSAAAHTIARLIRHLRRERAARSLRSEGRTPERPTCPACGVTAIFVKGDEYRCLKCGEEWTVEWTTAAGTPLAQTLSRLNELARDVEQGRRAYDEATEGVGGLASRVRARLAEAVRLLKTLPTVEDDGTPTECPNPHCDEGLIRGTVVGCAVCQRPVSRERMERAGVVYATSRPSAFPAVVPPAQGADEPGTTKRFRKKPVVIDAFRWVSSPTPKQLEPPYVEGQGGGWRELDAWLVSLGYKTADEADDEGDVPLWVNGDESLTIPTLEGDHRCDIGDWIIRGVRGEFYPCKPDIFALTYEPAVPQGDAAEPTREEARKRLTEIERLSLEYVAALDAYKAVPYPSNWFSPSADEFKAARSAYHAAQHALDRARSAKSLLALVAALRQSLASAEARERELAVDAARWRVIRPALSVDGDFTDADDPSAEHYQWIIVDENKLLEVAGHGWTNTVESLVDAEAARAALSPSPSEPAR